MSLNNVTKVNQECNSSEENKPIVYWDGKHFASKDKSSLADIPLYTHPHKEQEPDLYSEDGFPLWTSPQFKELTNEEILQQAEWMFGTYFFESIDDPYWIEFARAILRKAQEK